MRTHLDILQQHLVQAEYRAAEGRRLVIQQERLIAELEQRGLPTADAVTVLATLRDAWTIHEHDAQRLREKLGFT